MKLFRTSNTEIIAECQHYFGFTLLSRLIERKRNKFVNNYKNVSFPETCYGYDLIVCICRNVSPVYLFIFQLHLLFSLLQCLFMVNKDYQLHCIYKISPVVVLPSESLCYTLDSSWAAECRTVWLRNIWTSNRDNVLTSWSESAQQKNLTKRAHIPTREKLIRRTCAHLWTASRTEIGEQLPSARPVCITPNIVAHLNSTLCKGLRRCVQYSGIRHFHTYARYRALQKRSTHISLCRHRQYDKYLSNVICRYM